MKDLLSHGARRHKLLLWAFLPLPLPLGQELRESAVTCSPTGSAAWNPPGPLPPSQSRPTSQHLQGDTGTGQDWGTGVSPATATMWTLDFPPWVPVLFREPIWGAPTVGGSTATQRLTFSWLDQNMVPCLYNWVDTRPKGC